MKTDQKIIQIQGKDKTITIDMNVPGVTFDGKNWPVFPGQWKNLPAFLVEYVRIARKDSRLPAGKRKVVLTMTRTWLTKLGINTDKFEEELFNHRPQAAGN